MKEKSRKIAKLSIGNKQMEQNWWIFEGVTPLTRNFFPIPLKLFELPPPLYTHTHTKKKKKKIRISIIGMLNLGPPPKVLSQFPAMLILLTEFVYFVQLKILKLKELESWNCFFPQYNGWVTISAKLSPWRWLINHFLKLQRHSDKATNSC